MEEGGNQSRTLRLRGANGRTYTFRSANKRIPKEFPDDFKHGPVSIFLQDQTAAFHPTGHLIASALQEAVGVLHAPPTLVYMPDDVRLGKYRADFANRLGQIEERPDDDEGAEFAGADKVVSTLTLFEHLEESMEDRLDARDYLRARLIDCLVNDTDRGGDQWRFAKFEKGKHDVYRPLPRDRDFAFMKVEGWIASLGPRCTRASSVSARSSLSSSRSSTPRTTSIAANSSSSPGPNG